MAVLKSKQLPTRLSGSYVLSGSNQTLHGTTTIHGKVYHKNIVDITHPISAGESHLSIHNDTDYFTNIRQSIGEFIVEPNIGNIVLKMIIGKEYQIYLFLQVIFPVEILFGETDMLY